MKMNIVLWADLQCPFCYTGETNLKHAIEELEIQDQVKMDIKAYEIHDDSMGNGILPMKEVFIEKHGMTSEEAEQTIEEINKMGLEEAGLDLNFGNVRESNDHDAHRVYKMARERGCGEQVRNALFEAYFDQDLVLHDRNVLLDIAQKNGLDRDEVKQMLESNLYNIEVKNDQMEADAIGIGSVPCFFIDQEKIPEHITKEAFMEILKKHM